MAADLPSPDLLDQAALVAIKMACSYRGYESFDKASIALRRSARRYQTSEQVAALEMGVSLFEEAKTRLAAHLRRSGTSSPSQKTIQAIARNLPSAYPGYSKSTYLSAANMAAFWLCK